MSLVDFATFGTLLLRSIRKKASWKGGNAQEPEWLL
jgi:hypothetical protein